MTEATAAPEAKEKKKYTPSENVTIGVSLHEVPGELNVNPHGQVIIDALILSEEKVEGHGDMVTNAALKGLRSEEFYAKLRAAAPTKAKNMSLILGSWLTILRKAGFMVNVVVPRDSLKTKGKNAPVSKKAPAVFRTKEEILAAANA